MGSTPYVTQRWPRAGDARLSDFERRFRVAYEDYFDFVWRLPRAAARPAALSPAGPEPTIAILTLSNKSPAQPCDES